MKREFYVEGGDEWNIWSCVVNEEDHDQALWAALELQGGVCIAPTFVTERATGIRKKVLCLGCEQCRVPMFEDEEWMLTDKAGEYQHVDCFAPNRLPA